MDNLYANAWGESIKLDDQDPSATVAASSSRPALPSSISKPSWSSIGASNIVEDDEADLAAPSWSTGVEIRWNEPSEDSHGFGWSAAEPDMAWGTSTYDSIPLGKPALVSTPEPPPIHEDEEPVAVTPPSTTTLTAEEPDDNELPETHLDTGYASAYQSFEEAEPDTPSSPQESSSFAVPQPEPESPTRTPKLAALRSRSTSPDGFGGFSSGFESSDTSTGFKSQAAGSLEEDAWGSAWASGADETTDEPAEEVEDEWTAARRRQEQFDQRIPAGVVDDLKKQCEVLCEEITPKIDPKLVDSDPNSFRNNLRASIEDLDDFPMIKNEYLPELALQPPLNFPKTAIFKGVAGSLRLTRNLPMVKNSPMSHYLASKGSTAWEKSVKSQKDAVEEDVVPVGWRILEKEEIKPAAPVQKSSGGWFSSWGKKESKPANAAVLVASATSTSDSASSSKPSPAERVARSSTDRRSSVESSRSLSSSRNIDTSVKSSSPTTSTPPSVVSSPLTATPASPLPTAAPTSSYADAPIADLDGTEAPPQAAPSAVSRFLNRFSRRKPSVASSSPRSSLALSTDDLEFLSDIVPSASEEPTDDKNSLAAVLAPEPLPPLLAPPPVSTPTSSRSTPDPSSSKSLPPQPQSQPAMPYDSLFDPIESPQSNTSGSFPLLGGGMSPLQPSPSVASSSRPQSPSTLSPPTKPITPSPLSVGASPQFFGLPPPPTAPRIQTPVLPAGQKQPQSFMIPPPPSSRSQTPATSSPPSRPQSGLAQAAGRSRPHVPALIGIPPPPSSTSSPISPLSTGSQVTSADNLNPSTVPSTPTSGVPLALLYPNVVNAKPPPGASFGLPPVASRGHTPIPLPPPNAASSLKPILPPPAKPTQPTVLTSFEEEDDFADFQSSTDDTLQKAMPITPDSNYQSPLSATSAPMLGNFSSTSPSFGTSIAQQKASAHAFFKSATAAATRASKLPPPQTFDSFDDEFSAFASTSSPASSSQNVSYEFSGSSLLPPSRSELDGFDSFSSSPNLRTPSPPRPPAKSRPIAAPPSPSPKKRSGTLSSKPDLSIVAPPPPSSTDTASSHQRTISLMQMANARTGKQWPAPPSPLPMALVPPPQAPGGKSNTPSYFDLMGDDDDSFGSFNSTTIPAANNSITTSNSSPATLGHPLLPSSSTSGSNGLAPLKAPGMPQSQSTSSAGSAQWLMGAGSGSSSTQSVGAARPKLQSKPGGQGGLSAQDLSFFEGL